MSEFPAGEYKTPVSASHNRFLNPLGIASDYPFAVKREKGAYVLDIDGNKYVDFDMGRGSVILGHNDGRLTHTIKNALSTGTSTVFLNKFVHRVVRQLKALTPFERFAYFDGETSALAAVVQEFGGNTVCVNTSHLLELVRRAAPGSEVEIAVKGKNYDLAILEPVRFDLNEFDGDLGDTDFGAYTAKAKVSFETRCAFRFRYGFLKTLTDADAILTGANLTNGLGGAVVLTNRPIEGTLPPMFMTVAMNETLKQFRRVIDYGAFGFDLPAGHQAARRGPVILLKDEPNREALISRGVILRGRLIFLSAAHTEYDLKRLARAMGESTSFSSEKRK